MHLHGTSSALNAHSHTLTSCLGMVGVGDRPAASSWTFTHTHTHTHRSLHTCMHTHAHTWIHMHTHNDVPVDRLMLFQSQKEARYNENKVIVWVRARCESWVDQPDPDLYSQSCIFVLSDWECQAKFTWLWEYRDDLRVNGPVPAHTVCKLCVY